MNSASLLFGEFETKETILLLLFLRPTSKWDVNLKVSKFPKPYRIPESSLYKIVDRLANDGFVHVVEGSGRRGRGGMTVSDYALTLKGIFAVGINAYVLCLDPKTPQILRKSMGAEGLVQNFKSNPAWPFLIYFLKWHRGRRIDLSHAGMDPAYLGTTLAFTMLEHPEIVTLENFRLLADRISDFGIRVPDVTSKTVDEFRDSANVLRSFGNSLPVILENLVRSKHERDKKAKEAKS